MVRFGGGLYSAKKLCSAKKNNNQFEISSISATTLRLPILPVCYTLYMYTIDNYSPKWR